MTSKEILAKLSLEEKVKLTVGKDFWHTSDLLNFGSLTLTDGPHGLRKQVGKADHLGLNESIKATCFPTASCLACSFDEKLLYNVGQGIAKECINEEVDVLLGPGTNIKRSPLGGRNFEYYSEDPFLAGRLASSFVKGVESLNVMTSLKHFACNNQEYARMVNDSIVDERTLFEIYLKPFLMTIKDGKPSTIMTSYNRINGIYASENKRLLTDILRDKYHFEGAFISDWGAVNSKIESLKAGLNLEMPASLSYVDVLEAVNKGDISVEELDMICLKVIELYLKAKIKKEKQDVSINHELAWKAASESIVLLKNESDILPLDINENITIMGNLELRIQGAGSSKVNPKEVDGILNVLDEYKISYNYLNKYDLTKVKNSSKIIYFLQLDAKLETEGKDRDNLNLSKQALEELKKVTDNNSNVVVVLTTGAVVELPFINDIKGLLLTYLPGEAGAKAIIDILFNKVNPSGKLAETWVEKLADIGVTNFANNINYTIYNEALFVGYRYYDKTNIEPLFPFGYGLSYTKFEYKNIKLIDNQLSFTLKNIGKYKGKEIVQLYVQAVDSKILRPIKELKAFKKIELEPAEEKVITFNISKDFFEFYDIISHSFKVNGGNYELLIGGSLKDIYLRTNYHCDGIEFEMSQTAYKQMKSINDISLADFEELYGKKININNKLDKFTINSTMSDIKKTFIGRLLNYFGLKALKKRNKTKEEFEMSKYTFLTGPIRLMGMGLNKTTYQLEGIVDMVNGHLFKGLKKFMRKDPRVK